MGGRHLYLLQNPALVLFWDMQMICIFSKEIVYIVHVVGVKFINNLDLLSIYIVCLLNVTIEQVSGLNSPLTLLKLVTMSYHLVAGNLRCQRRYESRVRTDNCLNFKACLEKCLKHK